MKIAGTTVGRDLIPVSRAVVKVRDGGGEISNVRSNAQGRFECPVADSYADRPLKLLASADGYHTLERDVQCAADTDLGTLALSAVQEVATPTPPQPASPTLPWLKIATVTAAVLLLAVAVMLFLLHREAPIPKELAGNWLLPPASVREAGTITRMQITFAPNPQAKVIYLEQGSATPLVATSDKGESLGLPPATPPPAGPSLTLFSQRQPVDITRAPDGLPSFPWPVGNRTGDRKELRLSRDGRTLELVTSTSHGTSGTAQLFEKR